MVVKHPAKVSIAQAVSAFESRCLRHLCTHDVIGSHARLRSLGCTACESKSYLACHKNLNEQTVYYNMKQEIRENSYYLLDEDGNVLLKLTPADPVEFPGNQVVIETDHEVYAGPVKFISFSGDIK